MLVTRNLEVQSATVAQMTAYRANTALKTQPGTIWFVLDAASGIVEMVFGTGDTFANSLTLVPRSTQVEDLPVVASIDAGAATTPDTTITVNINGTEYLIEAEEVSGE